MKGGIYEIVNTVNGKRYIGSAVNFKNRWKSHRVCLNGNRHPNRHLRFAWNAYGKEAFVFRKLMVCAPEHLLMYEQRFLDAMKPEYNLSPTAGSLLGVKMPPRSPEYRARLSAARKGIKYVVTYKPTNEHKEKIAAAKRGRKLTPEHCLSMSLARKGKKQSEEFCAKRSLLMMGNKNLLGHKHTAESRAKMSAAHIGNKHNVGRKPSAESNAKRSATWERKRQEKALQQSMASMTGTF